MDRKDNIVTEETDKKDEENKIRNALSDCGYPKWALDRVKQQMNDKPQKQKKSKKLEETPSRGMVVIPYVEGLAEKLQRIFQKHKISTAMRPTNTLKNILVHPKDKKDIMETSDAVYDIPCKGCDKSYVGETGRPFGVRIKEHQKDSETLKDTKFTRSNRKASTTEQHKSAITDHIAQENHVINWEEASILDKDSNATSRRIREAIQIRRKGAKTINRDDGAYSLSHVVWILRDGDRRKDDRRKNGNFYMGRIIVKQFRKHSKDTVGGNGRIILVPSMDHSINKIPYIKRSTDPKATSTLNCNFESSNICDFTQAVDDDFDWIVKNGSTRSERTGPSSDHTYGTVAGHYIYVEASSPRLRDDTARLTSPQISAIPGIIYNCSIQFWYHMFGNHIGSLTVYSKSLDEDDVATLQWTKSGNQGDEWHLATFSFAWNGSDFQILFEGTRGPDIRGDIALDDIEINECIPTGLACNFEDSRICGFTHSVEDDFDWIVKNGSTRSERTGPSSDHTYGTPGGKYIYLEASSPRVRDDTALLISPRIITAPGYMYNCTVRFWYHMYGGHIGTLNVYTRSARSYGSAKVQWSKSGNQEDEWNLGTFSFTWTQSQFQIVFEGIRGPDIRGDIALDDIEIPKCVSSGLACTFDNSNLCGFTQAIDDDFDWTLSSGSTRSERTGPASDHTYGTSDGYYIYLEASSPQIRNDSARLISPGATILPGHVYNCTVTFWYHMYGVHIGTLNVYSKPADQEDLGILRWTRTDNHGDQWYLAEISFRWSGQYFQIVFEGIRGPDIKGDIALDDIQIPDCEIIPPDIDTPDVSGCPNDISATTELGTSGTLVDWTEPTAVDRSPIEEITQSHQPSTELPIGRTDVAYIFRDVEGNTAACTFTVTVITVDTTPPTVSGCPSDIHTETELGTGNMPVHWIEPSATDLSGIKQTVRTHAPSTEFPIGVTSVTYTFIDSSENRANCHFAVTVKTVDNRPPIVTNCPADFDIISGRHAKWIEPTAYDASNEITTTRSHSPGFIAFSSTHIEYRFTDSSDNIAYCNFSITVIGDAEPPIISGCPSDINISVEVGDIEAYVTWNEPTAMDDHERVMLIHNTRRPGSSFPVGSTNVVYTFADDSYNLAYCNFSVIINQVDTTPPIVTACPSNIIMVMELGTANIPVYWSTPTVIDLSGKVSIVSQSHNSGERFRRGKHNVTYSFADGSGNIALCTFSVTVEEVDTLSPTILYCPDNIDKNIEPDSFGMAVYWKDPVAMDNSEDVTVFVQTHTPGATFTQGTTLVTYIFTDDSDNLATCSFYVTLTTESFESLKQKPEGYSSNGTKYLGVSLAGLLLLVIIVVIGTIALLRVFCRRKRKTASNSVEMDGLGTSMASLSTIASKRYEDTNIATIS
ncbi:uncharacterized protein [Amphiura filiformis]|uniref:uncharacterized protein n=1 Tax=Amphiura filiformis TaxID=82378 RepID=UPI003B21116C